MIWTNGNKGAECIWLKRIRYGRLLKVDYLFNAQKSEMLSDVALANVEALAEGEVIVGMPCMVVPNNYCLYIGQTPDQDFELPGAFYY